MSELINSLFTEKYRPSSFDDMIMRDKETILKYINHPLSLPSFILHSTSPGTGKTSLSKIISNHLQCDTLLLNSSDERGIDTVREKINLFATSLSSNSKVKRMILMEEADALTKPAMDCLRVALEEHSDNCFFIFSINDLGKIILPIRSRCILIDFSSPPKKEIIARLEYICNQEKIEYDIEDLNKLVDLSYPDIRSMILTLQSCKIDNKPLLVTEEEYSIFLEAILKGNIDFIYHRVYGSAFNILAFNKWFFRYLLKNYNKWGHEKVSEIALLIADTEKHWALNADLEIVFIANVLQIQRILNQ